MESDYSKLRLTKTNYGNFYVSFYVGNTRYRYFNGRALNKDISPNNCPSENSRIESSKLLLAFKTALDKGWRPNGVKNTRTILSKLVEYRPKEYLSSKYRKALITSKNQFLQHLHKIGYQENEQINSELIQKYLDKFRVHPSSFNHERKRLHSIFNELNLHSERQNPVTKIKKIKEKQELNKSIDNLDEVFKELRHFNSNLHLCCLLTYGCLLRPHQEIRNLRWSDFSEDLTSISLSGKRNKSGRNRIVPVSEPVRAYLSVGEGENNIFTGTTEPYGESYFKVLWRRFKKQSALISTGQTLYSFRHTGALNVFEKTGSIAKLQRAMGHSDLKVTLTYLRGLEVVELIESDMPSIM